MDEFEIKDSGARQEFESGMVRDTAAGKIDYMNLTLGPMWKRYAAHMTKGREKYPDPRPGTPNWMLGSGLAEYNRAKSSALRHMMMWLAGEHDEDHAAAVLFNVNLAEYVLEKMAAEAVEDVREEIRSDLASYLRTVREDSEPFEGGV